MEILLRTRTTLTLVLIHLQFSIFTVLEMGNTTPPTSMTILASTVRVFFVAASDMVLNVCIS